MRNRNSFNLLAGGIALVFILTGTIATAKTPESTAAKSQTTVAEAMVNGFRSAKFSMTENDVYRAILIDFKTPKEQVVRNVHPTEKTVTLGIKTKDLVPESGTAHIFYIFGYQSQKLMQVNIVWGDPVDPTADPQGVVSTANQLRDHFIKEGYQRDGMAINARLPDESVLVFRGKDRLGRMVILLLKSAMTSAEMKKAPAGSINHMSLRLSYIEKPEAPDIFKIKKGDF